MDFFEVRQPFTAVSFGEWLVSTGDDAGALITPDLNGDGKLDLVTMDFQGSAITSLLGNGDGTFHFVTEYSMAHPPLGGTIGDFNADGILDLAVGISNAVAIFLGNGDGTFQQEQDFLVPFFQGGYSIVTGDFNRDGVLDLAVVNYGQTNIFVLLGNGDGTFQNPVSYTAGSSVFSLMIGDFNSDGILDLAVTDTADLAVLLGNGDGTFQSPVDYPVPQDPFVAVTADLNGDGILDVVAQCYQAGVFSVLLGNGDGTFRTHKDYRTGGSATELSIGDLNGDGILDVIVPNRTGFTVSSYLGNGDGTFQAANGFPVVGSFPGFVAVADFNGDGIADLAAANSKPNLNVLPGVTAVLSTTAANFGKVHVGRSASINVTFSNIGSTAISIKQMVLNGQNPSDFGTKNACGKSLAAGASCTITLVFKPQVAGTFIATLQITDNAAKGVQTIYLSGSGV